MGTKYHEQWGFGLLSFETTLKKPILVVGISMSLLHSHPYSIPKMILSHSKHHYIDSDRYCNGALLPDLLEVVAGHNRDTYQTAFHGMGKTCCLFMAHFVSSKLLQLENFTEIHSHLVRKLSIFKTWWMFNSCIDICRRMSVNHPLLEDIRYRRNYYHN